MTQINGSLSFDTEKIGRELTEVLQPSMEALHASLAALSERLNRPAPMTVAQAADALTGPLDTVRALSLAELLYSNGFALTKLSAPTEPERSTPGPSTPPAAPRNWFDRSQD